MEAVFTKFKYDWNFSLLNRFMKKRLLGLYGHERNSSDTNIKGFAMAGIKDTLMMELPLEDPFADLDA